MTATPLKEASPGHKLAVLAARRAGGKLSDEQRQQLDQHVTGLVDKAGPLAEPGIIVARFTLTESPRASLAAFSSAVAILTAEPLPPVHEDYLPVPISAVFHLMRTALDLGHDGARMSADIGQVIELFRKSYVAVGSVRDQGNIGARAIIDLLPDATLEDIETLGVVDAFRQIGYETIRDRCRDQAEDAMEARHRKPRPQVGSDQNKRLADVMSHMACARASSDELLGAIFNGSVLDRLYADCQAAIEKAGGLRAAVGVARILTRLSKHDFGYPISFAETIAEVNRRALTPRGHDPDCEVF